MLLTYHYKNKRLPIPGFDNGTGYIYCLLRLGSVKSRPLVWCIMFISFPQVFIVLSVGDRLFACTLYAFRMSLARIALPYSIIPSIFTATYSFCVKYYFAIMFLFCIIKHYKILLNGVFNHNYLCKLANINCGCNLRIKALWYVRINIILKVYAELIHLFTLNGNIFYINIVSLCLYYKSYLLFKLYIYIFYIIRFSITRLLLYLETKWLH